MKTHIYIDAYDDDRTQKSFIMNTPVGKLIPMVLFDKIFLKINAKSASYIAVDKITHIKIEE